MKSKIIKLKDLVVLILLVVFVTISSALEVAFTGLLFGFHLDPITGSILTIGLLYFLVLLGPWIREIMKVTQTAYLAIAVLMPFALGSYFYPWCFLNQFLGARLLQPKLYNELLPRIWAPPPEHLKTALTGGVSVPWSYWLPSMTYWYIFTMFSILTSFAIAGIVKERWNRIEKLPYPHATLIERTVEFTAEEKRGGRWLFHLGISLGIIVYLPWLLHQLLPWFPNIYGWNEPPFRRGIPSLFDLVVFSPTVKQYYASILTFQTSPVEVALFYIVPLDVLLTAWISWLLFLVILPQIAYTLGYYPKIPALADSIARYDVIGREDPLKIHAMAGVGMFLGVFLWPIVLNIKWYLRTIKEAIKGSPIRELKKGELEYSFHYFLFIISFIILVVLMIVAGAKPFDAIWLFLVVTIHSLAMARQYAEAAVGFSGGWWGTLQALTYHVLYKGKTLEAVDQSYFTIQLMAHSLICAPASSLTHGPLYYSLLAYKLGEECKIKEYNIFKALVIATLVCPIIALILVTSMWYTFGYHRIPISVDGWWWPDRWTNPSLIAPYPSKEPWWLQALIGLIISGGVFYFRLKYYWFPLNGIGLLFGTIGGAWGHAFTAFIAWLLKYLTVKLGGAKVYEEYGISLASGFVLGYVFSIFALGLGKLYRFFLPY